MAVNPAVNGRLFYNALPLNDYYYTCYTVSVMKITILNGNPEKENNAFDDYLKDLSDSLESSGHEVTTFTIRDLNIRYCIGCFGCWVKTPGECSTAVDDSITIRREYINSDLVLFASPIIMGFTSAILKRVHDKLLPLLLPFIGFFGGECHHIARYDKYPSIGLLLQPDSDTDDEDIDIIADIYRRDAINFKTDFVLSHTTGKTIGDLADEINSI